jgi:cytochrome c-type biogenesis protein CcmH/NrfF
MRPIYWFLGGVMLWIVPGRAAIDPAAGGRIASLENRLLAPCCYEEPVSRHQSEAALKMRMEIERLVTAGKSEQEVIDYYVREYGSKIMAGYAPTPGWAQFVPWGLAIAAACVLGWWIRRMVLAYRLSQA